MFGPFFKTLVLAWGNQYTKGPSVSGRLSVQNRTRPAYRWRSAGRDWNCSPRSSTETEVSWETVASNQSIPQPLCPAHRWRRCHAGCKPPLEGSGLGDLLLVGTSTLGSRSSWA